MQSIPRNNRTVYIPVLLLMIVMVLGLAGCGNGSDMPYNGDIAFHEIHVTIPDGFIRDSTQSGEDTWIFEEGFYTKIIILNRSDITGDTAASIDGYAAYMAQQGADSRQTTFLDKDAVLSTYTLEDTFCQEMLFAHNGSFYAVALRGGTEAEFKALLDTVEIPDA